MLIINVGLKFVGIVIKEIPVPGKPSIVFLQFTAALKKKNSYVDCQGKKHDFGFIQFCLRLTAVRRQRSASVAVGINARSRALFTS